MSAQSLERTIVEVATPGNAALPSEGSTPEKSGSPKASGGTVAPPKQSTDPGGNFKASEKAGDSTKKTKGRRGDKQGQESSDTPTTIADPTKKVLSPENVKEEDMEDAFGFDTEELEEDELPMTRAGIAKSLLDAIQEMDKDELTDLLGAVTEASEEEVDEDEGEEYEVEESLVYEIPRITSDDLDLSDDLSVIVSGEAGLSEEFQNNAKILFESAVVAKVNGVIDQLEENYKVELSEAIESISSELTEKVDGYLNYVVEEWMKENELAVERGIRSEITEDFITGLRNLFQEHYIDMPEEKVDVAEALAEKVETLESQLNQVVESNIELQRALKGHEQSEMLDELTNDLADTESEKLRGLAEGIEFEDNDQYRDALETLRGKYFPKSDSSLIAEETLVDGLDVNYELSWAMAAYTNTLGRTVRN